MVVHGFLRTEEEQCGGNSHSRDASTNNDESIFITVTNCHKKHTLTVTLPPAFPPARRRAPPTSLTHTLAPPTPTPTPNATPHNMRVPKHVKILVTQFKRPHCTRRMPANDITLTQMSHMSHCHLCTPHSSQIRRNYRHLTQATASTKVCFDESCILS